VPAASTDDALRGAYLSSRIHGTINKRRWKHGKRKQLQIAENSPSQFFMGTASHPPSRPQHPQHLGVRQVKTSPAVGKDLKERGIIKQYVFTKPWRSSLRSRSQPPVAQPRTFPPPAPPPLSPGTPDVSEKGSSTGSR